MPTLAKKQGAIYYEVHGEGEPLVMLRGLGRSIKHWLGYDRKLAERFQVITMELRGIGRSTLPHGMTTSLFDLADDVADVLTALKIPQAHIFGVSLGGMVTLGCGLRHPERCRSLITVNTSIAGQKTLRMSFPGAYGLISGALGPKEKLHANLARAMVGKDCSAAKQAEIAAKYAAIAASDGLHARTVVAQLSSAARFRVRERLKEMRVPTLVVYGTDDAFVPNANSIKLAKLLPNSSLSPVAGGGHELTLDRADELTAAVAAWIAAHPAIAAR